MKMIKVETGKDTHSSKFSSESVPSRGSLQRAQSPQQIVDDLFTKIASSAKYANGKTHFDQKALNSLIDIIKKDPIKASHYIAQSIRKIIESGNEDLIGGLYDIVANPDFKKHLDLISMEKAFEKIAHIFLKPETRSSAYSQMIACEFMENVCLFPTPSKEVADLARQQFDMNQIDVFKGKGEQRYYALLEALRNIDRKFFDSKGEVSIVSESDKKKFINGVLSLIDNPAIPETERFKLKGVIFEDLCRSNYIKGDGKSEAYAKLLPRVISSLISDLNNPKLADNARKMLAMLLVKETGWSEKVLQEINKLAEGKGPISDKARELIEQYKLSSNFKAKYGDNGSSLSTDLNPWRFSPETQRAVLSQRSQTKESSPAFAMKPIAVIILPRDDHNGAFMGPDNEQMIKDLTKQGYSVQVYEVGSEKELITCLRDVKQRAGKPADCLIISGHGAIDSIQFGHDENKGDLSSNDYHVYDVIKKEKLVNPKGVVILNSCETDNPSHATTDTPTVAQQIKAEIVPEGQLFAPSEPITSIQLNFVRDSSTGTGRVARVNGSVFRDAPNSADGFRKASLQFNQYKN